MARPLLAVVAGTDAARDEDARPVPVKVPDGVETTARNLHGRLARVVATLSGGHSTDIAMTRARREALQIGNEICKLGRRL